MLKNFVKNIISLEYKDILSYNFPLDEVFGLEIIKNGNKYNFIIKLASNNENLLCLASGAQSRNRTDEKNNLICPPYFDRWSWYALFEESIIAYADPSFFKDETITLGWYVGGEDWYLEIISQIIKKICINQKIAQNNILCYGNAGGGFASIALATLIDGSKALVNNSSFDVHDFTEQHYLNLLKFLENELNFSENENLNKIEHRLNLNKLFLKMHHVPRITIFVNVCSVMDFNKRTKDFLDDLFENPYFRNDLVVNYYYNPGKEYSNNMTKNRNDEFKIVNFFVKSQLYNDIGESNPYLKMNYQIENYEKSILKMNNEIQKFMQDLNELTIENHKNKNTIYSNEIHIKQLSNQVKILQGEISDKHSENNALKEQINILKSIINKKDSIIQSLK